MRKILIQLDTDALPSTFDRVVAIDAGVDELFSYGGVTPENVTSLIHGAIFTRGVPDLKHTAIFIGGSDVAAGEALLRKVKQTFFGPMRVSVLIDSNGSNTTAAAAVRAAVRHVDPKASKALILGGTGPVGHRAAQILASLGAEVRLASRTLNRAEQTCAAIRACVPQCRISPSLSSSDEIARELTSANIVIAAGAAGVQLCSLEMWQSSKTLRVAIDLNAVPPLGIEGIDFADKAKVRESILCYGAIGVGGTKMKVHKAAVSKLFESNDQILDTASVYQIAETLG